MSGLVSNEKIKEVVELGFSKPASDLFC